MTDIDLGHVVTALAVFVPITAGLAALWQRATHDMRRSADWRARVDEQLSGLATDLSGLADRVSSQESRGGPTHEDMLRLHRRMDAMDGRLSRLEGGTEAARETLALIHHFLLHGRGNGEKK